jgi:Spy/CpxP family protein refolding chaperone
MKFINKGNIIAALAGGIAALALTTGGVALAYGSGHGGPHGKGAHWSPEKMEEHLIEMTQRLDLNAEQEANIRAIMEQAVAQHQELKELPRGKEKFVAMKDVRFATEDQIYANLTCAQREELRLLKREHKVERMEERFENRKSEHSK